MAFIEILTGLIVGLLSGYLYSYFKEKGKIKALRSNLKEITKEKEKIKSDFSLSNDRKRHQYEVKSKEYFEYFRLMDQFEIDENLLSQETLSPLVYKLFEEMMASIDSPGLQAKSLNDFSSQIDNYLNETRRNLKIISKKTNTLKLIAGEKVLSLIDDVEVLYNESFSISSDLIGKLPTMATYAIENEVDLNTLLETDNLRELGFKLKETQESLKQEIRKELDEI